MLAEIIPAAVDSGATTGTTSLPSPIPSTPAEAWLACVVDVLCKAGGLTPAERQVLEPLLLGRRYTEIATILGKSPHTVGVQVKAILRRLEASNSRDLFRVFLCELDRHAVTGTRAPI